MVKPFRPSRKVATVTVCDTVDTFLCSPRYRTTSRVWLTVVTATL